MKSLYKLLIFLFIFLPSTITTIHANEIFKHLNIDNGLAHTDANCLAQDSTADMIGTFAGLQSYDGYTLETFDYYPQGTKCMNHTTASGQSFATRTGCGWVRKAD